MPLPILPLIRLRPTHFGWRSKLGPLQVISILSLCLAQRLGGAQSCALVKAHRCSSGCCQCRQCWIWCKAIKGLGCHNLAWWKRTCVVAAGRPQHAWDTNSRTLAISMQAISSESAGLSVSADSPTPGWRPPWAGHRQPAAGGVCVQVF